MLENNDGQLQELEEKLESLSQRLEDLQSNSSSFDPFDQYDVERMLEDFRAKEQGLESQVEESEEVVQSVVGDDFIQVNTSSSQRSKFEVHWISITECGIYTDCSEILSNTEAKEAFKYAISSRANPASSKRKIQHGDVLILLCRNSGKLPADASEGGEPLKKSCTHIGMYTEYSSRQAPEPDAAEEVENKISDSNGLGDVFVWSSCAECENLEQPVDILTVSDSDSDSGSGSSGSLAFLKSGDDDSPYDSGELEYITDLEIAEDKVETDYTTRGLVIDSNTSSVTAGYYGALQKLGTKLSDYYVDYNKNKFKIKSEVGNINTGLFELSSGSSLLRKPLLSDECGNLRISVYQSESAINFFGGSVSDTSGSFSSFNKNLSVSLGNLELVDMSEVDNALAIPSLDIDVSPLEDVKKIFFPVINANDAGGIATTDRISYLENYELTIEAKYNVIYQSENKGDAEYYFYKKEKKVNDAKFASGLFYDGGDEDPDGTEKVLLGIISVKNVPLKYSCDPLYGCMPDPAGHYYEDTCGGNCEYYSFTPSGSDGSIWLWDAAYISIGPEDNADISEGDWGYEDTLQYREDYTHLIYNGQRYRLDPPNSGQFEFEWHANVNGSTQYLGGHIGMFSGSLPFEWTVNSGVDLWRRVTTSRPAGYPVSLPSKDTLTGEIIDEEDFIEFNF